MLKALTLTLAGTLPLLLASSPAEAAPRRFPTAIVCLGHNDLVVHDVQVTPGNGGINPDAFAFVVKASVMKGSNPCVAANTQVRFLQQRVGDQIQLRAVRRTIDPTRRCTMEYNPKFVTLTTTVRAFASQTRSVIIKNVDERGHDVDARDFL
jgi:hypothetical protein